MKAIVDDDDNLSDCSFSDDGEDEDEENAKFCKTVHNIYSLQT